MFFQYRECATVHIVPQLMFDAEIDRCGCISFFDRYWIDSFNHPVGDAELPRDEIPRVFHLPVEVAFEN